MTTIQQESRPDERVFIIRGEPVVRGLAWLTWGPVAALLAIIAITGFAINLNVREQGGMTRFLFIAFFLILPAIAWGVATIITNRLAKKHVQAERQADTQKCLIRMNQERGEFVYQTTSSAAETLTYDQIRSVKVTPAIGGRNDQSMRLTLETDQGATVLLNEALGNQAQKTDLAREINVLLKGRKVFN